MLSKDLLLWAPQSPSSPSWYSLAVTADTSMSCALCSGWHRDIQRRLYLGPGQEGVASFPEIFGVGSRAHGPPSSLPFSVCPGTELLLLSGISSIPQRSLSESHRHAEGVENLDPHVPFQSCRAAFHPVLPQPHPKPPIHFPGHKKSRCKVRGDYSVLDP